MANFSASDIGARAKLVRDENGLSQQEMADRLGMSLRGWQKIERGEGTPNGETLLGFGRFSVNPGWVLTGYGPKYLNEPQEKGFAAENLIKRAVEEMRSVAATASEMVRETFDPPPAPTIKFLPLKASAGGGSAVLSESVGVDLDMDALAAKVLGVRRKHIRLLEIKGDSMLPTLAHGDFAVIDTSQPFAGEDPSNDKVYVVSLHGDLFAKRALWVDLETLHWCSDGGDSQYPPIVLQREDLNQVKVIGRVIWSWKPI
ncbi:XRE family transcriptional regulator [Agrobacterium deltaense]|uniref:XRE family transcriptional regulator n=1 Tax=Agrobacterium deltaense TaxID=1183412 RepID=UPI001C6E8FBD|nr:LexA family transcriptional regulator [Agrobacterium deltaense]MBW9072192.1 LexA family transcriptional regulator [Agrobacterium deltaense]